MRAAALLSLALLCGCGARPPATGCVEPAERTTQLPACIETDRGPMSVEAEYVPGVVECELGATQEGAALEAQAIAARTYLAGYLQRLGVDVEIPIGGHFQCWRRPKNPRTLAAARYTADILMTYDGALVTANYVAGARVLRMDCSAGSPADNGYDEDDTWASMRAAYLEARRARAARPFDGTAWTEVVVTRNEGRSGDAVERTPMAGDHPANRGAMSQNAAVCLARDAGYEVEELLRYVYGDDIVLTPALVTPSG